MSRQTRQIALKKIIKILSSLLFLLSIIFVVYKFHQLKGMLNLSDFFQNHTAFFILAILIYAINNLFLSAGWWSILRGLKEKLSYYTATEIFGISQLAKYIPGNIFQFAGKQMLALEYQLGNKAVAKSQLLEVIFLVLSSLAFVLYISLSSYLNVNAGFSLFTFAVFIFVSFVVSFIVNPHFFQAIISYVVFMFVSGGVFLAVIYQLNTGEMSIAEVFFILCCFVTAWFLGFIVPGSPAGLGVRESILIILLTPIIHDQSIIFQAAILTRLITVYGDFIFFLGTFSLKRLRNGRH